MMMKKSVVSPHFVRKLTSNIRERRERYIVDDMDADDDDETLIMMLSFNSTLVMSSTSPSHLFVRLRHLYMCVI